MLFTSIFKFKKRELTDSPPDITATNDNWDTVEKELFARVEKSQIKNNLTETAIGNVLDASQGKILADKINGRYSKEHIAIDNTQDLYLLENGNYIFEGTVPSGKNYPPELVSTYQHLTIHISGTNGTGNVNGYKVIDISGAFGEIYKNTQRWSTWQGWQQISTTTKTAFSCTANSGYILIGQENYITNNEFVINMMVKKIDGTAFGANTFNVATLPFNAYGTVIGSSMCKTSASAWISQSNAYVIGNSLTTGIPNSTINEVYVNVRGRIV